MAEQLTPGGPQYLGDPAAPPAGAVPQVPRQVVAGRPNEYPLSPPAPRRPIAPRPPARRSAPGQGPVQVVSRPRAPYRLEGLICLIVAASWSAGAIWLHDYIGTMTVMQLIGRASKLSEKSVVAAPAPNPAPTADGAQAESGPARPAGRGLSFLPSPATPARRSPPVSRPSANLTQFQSPRPPGDALTAEQRLLLDTTVAEITRAAWGALTFALAGVIGVAGLNAATRTMASRLVWLGLIGASFGVSAGALVATCLARGLHWDSGLNSWLLMVFQSDSAWSGLVVIGGLTALLAALFALRPAAHPRRWLSTATVLIILGTLATLVGIYVLENHARFPALAGWVYVVVTVAQAALALPLGLMLQDRRRHPVAAPR